jgi:hypothetical protein
MKSFKFIREGYSVEPGVSEINDVPEDPLSFVEIKPKKTKVVKEDLLEAVSVKKQKHSWGTMMTVHHGSDTSYPLHPEHQSAIKKLRPGMKTTFKDETNSTVHAHREGDTVHLTRPKSGSTLTSLPYHHFDTSEHAKPSAKKPAGEYDRKVTGHLKKKYNEENMVETKGAPKGFHFTKDGKLKRGDANQDGDGGTMLRADPLDKQRNKIPAVSEKVEPITSKDIKMAVGVAKDKRYAGGNMSGAVKTMEKMKPGLSKHPRVQQVLKSTQEGYSDDDMESTRQFRSAITGLKAKSAIDKAKDGAGAKYYHDGAKVTPQETARRSAERKAQKDKKGMTEGIDFLKIWNGIKPVHEEIKTTHEDPLVVTKDEDGNIHTHANLSVANAIHGTNVKHQAIHTYKKVQDGKFTFELSKHHAGALKEDAPFDPVAHKKELDKLMGKHMAAHTETSKLISAKAPQEAINKAQERNNAVKAEIRAHKDKVPKGPAPKKDGGPGDYYASKKPGEYTGD